MIKKIEKLYHEMVLIRKFEEKVDWLFAQGMIGGTTHLCVGQEAVAVGAISEIQESDYIVSTHRGHGHLLSKGANPKKLMAELFGKETGFCRGKGGTQHLCMIDKNFVGTNGITGGGIPIATGVAMSLKLKKSHQLVLNFIGDGATNQGTFHESLNMASLWNLPIIYFCENNYYAMSLPVSQSMVVENIADRACAYQMKSYIVDGMNLLDIMKNMSEAVEYVREKQRPVFIEAKTYRYLGHSKSDKRAYRSRDEEEEWKKRDPILYIQNYLINSGYPKSYFEDIELTIDNIIEESVEFAQNSPIPESSVALEGAYANA